MSAHTAPLVVLATGGTGGHVFPAEALAAALKPRGCRLALITDRRGGAFSGALADVETHRVPAGGVAGRRLSARAVSVGELLLGTWKATGLLRALKPAVVVGFGGYASVPTMLAATRFPGARRFATLIHEQNAILGRANRLLAGRVGRIATAFESMRALPPEVARRVVHTGMPVRPAILAVRRRRYPALSAGRPIRITVIGGSQGAHVFAGLIPDAIGLLPNEIRSRLTLSQQCRPEDLDSVRAAYDREGIAADLSPFFANVPDRLAESHLIIARSGASTVAEALAVGRPSILVPYPHAVDDHQAANAHAVADAGAGWLMPQDTLDAKGLAARLTALFSFPATLRKAAACAHVAARPEAAQRLADVVMEMLGGNGEGHTDGRREAA